MISTRHRLYTCRQCFAYVPAIDIEVSIDGKFNDITFTLKINGEIPGRRMDIYELYTQNLYPRSSRKFSQIR